MIKFGTDGWRAIDGEDFTPENVATVIQAFCDVQRGQGIHQGKVYVGFDRRSHSKEISELVVRVLAGNGFEAFLATQFCPTPCVSWEVKTNKGLAGIMITASHNPWQWNGVKFKEGYGGAASPAYTDPIEVKIQELMEQGIEPKIADADHALIKNFDPTKEYVDQIRSLVDVGVIQKSNIKILHDCMHGTASDFLDQVLPGMVTQLHTDQKTNVEGPNPEPIPKNLETFLDQMKQGSFDLGIANDGDADRIGAADHEGNYLSSHDLFALLLQHYVEDKKLRGAVIKSVSATAMIDRLARKYGLELIETKIGFKFICEQLEKHDGLMGGEESGGLSFAGHVHERDGVLNAAMLAEMMAERGQSVQELLASLAKVTGKFYFDRHDCHISTEEITRIRNILPDLTADNLAGLEVARINRLDGAKFILEDDSWLMIRASGTEPLIRIYAEVFENEERVNLLIEEGKRLLTGA